jgi:hypothetical protein
MCGCSPPLPTTAVLKNGFSMGVKGSVCFYLYVYLQLNAVVIADNGFCFFILAVCLSVLFGLNQLSGNQLCCPMRYGNVGVEG